MLPELIYSRPYRDEDVRTLCHLAKSKPDSIKADHLEPYARVIDPHSILIPVPGHLGDVTMNINLAFRLRFLSKAPDVHIINAIKGVPRESLCKRKRTGLPTDDVHVEFQNDLSTISPEELKKMAITYKFILIDNVLDTGRTVRAAAKAIGLDCCVLTLGYTGADEGIFNPFRMLDTLREGLDKSYDLVDTDYRDELPPKDFNKILKEKSLYPLTEKDYYGESRYHAARYYTEQAVTDSDFSDEEKQRFTNTDEFFELIREIEERDSSTPELDLLKNSSIHGRIELDSNYDCWIPPYDAGAIYSKDDLLWGLMAELCLNPKKVKNEILRVWDVPIKGTWPDIQSRNGKEAVSYKDFVNVLLECPNYGKWSFFGVFDGGALHEKHYVTDSMTIPKGTTCTMYNSWNGGGSCATATTLRDIPLRELRKRAARHLDGVSVIVDEKNCEHGYASNEVYDGHLSNEPFLT